MAEDEDARELAELKALMEKNTEAIENLRAMVENLQILLTSLNTEEHNEKQEP